MRLRRDVGGSAFQALVGTAYGGFLFSTVVATLGAMSVLLL